MDHFQLTPAFRTRKEGSNEWKEEEVAGRSQKFAHVSVSLAEKLADYTVLMMQSDALLPHCIFHAFCSPAYGLDRLFPTIAQGQSVSSLTKAQAASAVPVQCLFGIIGTTGKHSCPSQLDKLAAGGRDLRRACRLLHSNSSRLRARCMVRFQRLAVKCQCGHLGEVNGL